jgi:outer membrane receptor protein involved in Fe transport
MKAISSFSVPRHVHLNIPATNRRAYWTAICLASLACGSGVSSAQTTNAPSSAGSTNAPSSVGSTNVTKLQETTVVGHLDQARTSILPDLGATVSVMSADQITSGSQGANAPFNDLILRFPGVAEDSAANGDLHVRGEHANLQYRINDVLLPEGITGFGLELDPRFVENLKFITGSLPAQYGFRTAGVVDIQTKSGAFENGGQGEIYGGSHDTIRPTVELGGSEGNLNYFIDGSYDHNTLGIENPTSSHEAIHDKTDQGKMFSYLSYVLDDTSRVNLMLSASDSNFQVPNTPGLAVGTAPGGAAWNADPASTLPAGFESTVLNERQNEQNYYGVVTYQKSAGDLNLEVSAIGRDSSVHFMPDPVGDLFFNGVASDVYRRLVSGGLQADASYYINDQHTVRGGMIFDGESVKDNSATKVFDMTSTDPATFNPLPGAPPRTIAQSQDLYGLFTGFYLQDEWKIMPKVTLNYGARFDIYNSSFDNENQLSPRANLIYQPTDKTTLHAGYARYFTPPPTENVPANSVNVFDKTSNESLLGPNAPDGTVKAERSDYFDAGISQELAPGLRVGVDGYYKEAHNQLDDGLFGQTLILSAFNYARGVVYGTEFTINYTQGGFSTYANIAYSVAKGEDWVSAQFLFDPAALAYVQNHYIALDHDQTVSGSFGASYLFNESQRCNTRVYVDALYGSGLRQNGGGTIDAAGELIPNGDTVPSYYSVNCGAEQTFKISNRQALKARIDIVNITDNSYELRSGSGVGVNAAQFGAPRGIFGSLTYVF